MFDNRSGRKDQSQYTTFHRLFGSAVAEEKFLLEINKTEIWIVCGGHACKRIGSKWAIGTEDIRKMLPTKLQFIWSNGFRGEEF